MVASSYRSPFAGFHTLNKWYNLAAADILGAQAIDQGIRLLLTLMTQASLGCPFPSTKQPMGKPGLQYF